MKMIIKAKVENKNVSNREIKGYIITSLDKNYVDINVYDRSNNKFLKSTEVDITTNILYLNKSEAEKDIKRLATNSKLPVFLMAI